MILVLLATGLVDGGGVGAAVQQQVYSPGIEAVSRQHRAERKRLRKLAEEAAQESTQAALEVAPEVTDSEDRARLLARLDRVIALQPRVPTLDVQIDIEAMVADAAQSWLAEQQRKADAVRRKRNADAMHVLLLAL